MIRHRRRNGNAWLAALESGQISPGTVESEILRLRIQLEDEVGLGYPEERVEKTRASLRDAEEALRTGVQKWESAAKKRFLDEPEHPEPSVTSLVPVRPRTEKDEAQQELDEAKKRLDALRRELKLAIQYGDSDDVIAKIRSDINKQITVVSDAEWDLSRARDVPVRALVPTVVPTRAARPEPSEDQMRAERERAETARRVASARAGLADVNRQIRMLERDLDEAERFGSPEEAAEIQAKLVALNAEAAGFEATLKTKNPRRNPRRNSDERIRELERAFDEARTSRVARDRFLTAVLRSGLLTDVERRRIEQPVQVDADASEDERLRMERGREVDIEEIALDLLNPAFEKFVSWDHIYERMQRVSRDEKPETIDQACFRWVDDALSHNLPDAIESFEHKHGVKLTKAQREAMNEVWDSVLTDACRDAFVADLKWVVRNAVELVNRAATSDICENAFEARGLPSPEQLSGARRKAIRGWREGEDEHGESGVWFSLSRTFLRSYAEAAYCTADYHPDAARAHPDQFHIGRFDGDDVILTAKRWGECVGERLAMPSQGCDPATEITYPKDADVVAAMKKVGPLRKRRRS
jgi:hypothetical protein